MASQEPDKVIVKPRKREFTVVGVAVLVAFLIGAGVMALVLGGDAGSSSDGSSSTDPGVETVEPGVPASTAIGGTEVSLPADAVISTATLSVVRDNEIPPPEAEIAGTQVEIDLDQELEADAELDFGDLRPGDIRKDSVLVPAFFDENSADWIAVDSFRQGSASVVARTSHFTPFALLRFIGFRSSEPKCKNPLDKDVLNYAAPGASDNTRLLFACAEADGSDAVTVKVVNNRGYLMPIQIPESVKFNVKQSSSIEDATLQLIQSAADSVLPDRTVLVPGGTELTLRIPDGSKPFSIDPHPNQGIAAFGIIVDQLIDIGFAESAVPDLLKCVFRAGSLAKNSNWFDTGEITEMIVDCSKPLVQHNKKSMFAKIVKFASGLLAVKTMANIYESNLDQLGGQLSRVFVKAPSDQEAQTSAPVRPDQDGMQYIGAITMDVTNSDEPAVRVDYWVDQPIESGGSEPPIEALQACNADYSLTQAHSVYVRGRLEATNEQDQFPQVLGLGSTRPVGGYIPWGVPTIATEDGGSWTCGGSAYTLDSGESVTEDFWLLIPALDEQNPVITEDMKNSWSIDIPQGTPVTGTTPSGPGAVNCDGYKGDDLLMLYGRPPFSLEGSRMSPGSDEEAICR